MAVIRATAETVGCASSTVEDGGRGRLWSGCEPKLVSDHATPSPRTRQIVSNIVCGSKVDMAADVSIPNRA